MDKKERKDYMRVILKIPIPEIALIELFWPLTEYEWQRIEDILKAYRSLSENALILDDDKEILSQEIMKSTIE
jgi:hypothetical protein